jgi:hypothetical protein
MHIIQRTMQYQADRLRIHNKNRGQIPGRIHADFIWFYTLTKPKRKVSGDTSPGCVCAELSAIATRFHDLGRSYKDWSYTSTKPKREVSGDDSPGRICADLLANSLGVSRPPPILDWTYTSTKPIGKSQEVNFLAIFGTDLSAIASEFQDPRQSQIGLIHRQNP